MADDNSADNRRNSDTSPANVRRLAKRFEMNPTSSVRAKSAANVISQTVTKILIGKTPPSPRRTSTVNAPTLRGCEKSKPFESVAPSSSGTTSTLTTIRGSKLCIPINHSNNHNRNNNNNNRNNNNTVNSSINRTSKNNAVSCISNGSKACGNSKLLNTSNARSMIKPPMIAAKPVMANITNGREIVKKPIGTVPKATVLTTDANEISTANVISERILQVNATVATDTCGTITSSAITASESMTTITTTTTISSHTKAAAAIQITTTGESEMLQVATSKPRPPPKPPKPAILAKFNTGAPLSTLQTGNEKLINAVADDASNQSTSTALSPEKESTVKMLVNVNSPKISPSTPSSAQSRLAPLQRPKIKPPPPKLPGSGAILPASTSTTLTESGIHAPKEADDSPNPLSSNTNVNFSQRNVVRKPSLRPPPPPTGATPTRTSATRNSVVLPIDSCPFTLPRMPAIPPPLPPAVEAPRVPPLLQNPPNTDNNHETFDQLYEEIEHFYQRDYAPKLCNAHFSEVSPATSGIERYVPKYRKKSATPCQSPPAYYRTSTNLPETRAVAHTYEMLDGDYGSTDKPTSVNAATLPTEFRRNSQNRVTASTDVVPPLPDFDASVLSRDARRASYRQARFQRQRGRFDTWSAPSSSDATAAGKNHWSNEYNEKNGNVNTLSLYYGSRDVDYSFNDESIDGSQSNTNNEGVYGNYSVENYHVECSPATPSFRVTTSATMRSRHSSRRRPLSELWRFKSELQLNLSKKVSRICAKVESSVAGGIHHRHSSGESDERNKRRSVFYVETASFSRCSQRLSRQLDTDIDSWTPMTDKQTRELLQREEKEQHKTENQLEDSAGRQKESLLAEIESAYIELQLRDSTRPIIEHSHRDSSSPSLTNSLCALAQVPSSPQPPLQPPSLPRMLETAPPLLRSASDVGKLPNTTTTSSTDETGCAIASRYDELHNVTQHPSSSASSTSTSMSSIMDNRELSPTSTSTEVTKIDTEQQYALEEVITTLATASPLIKSHVGERDEEEDEICEGTLHNSYTSWLPAPQPLYQHYMKQEQARLYNIDTKTSGAKSINNKANSITEDLQTPQTIDKLEHENATTSASLSASTSHSTNDTINVASEPEVNVIAVDISTNDCNVRKKTVTLNAPSLTDEHEADSVCDSTSNDDIAAVCIRRQSSSVSTDSGRGADIPSHVTPNTSMRRERLTAGSVYGSQRSLWCELPEVKSAGLLDSLDKPSKRLQEAYFEVITSEASYLRSLNVLITKFMATPELLGSTSPTSIITSEERKQLFSNIKAIRDCSERLLCDLEQRLKENLVLSDVCDILCKHFENKFTAYVNYCSNQVFQDRTLKRLKMTNTQFLNCINKIEADRQCQGLDMRSFLMLPMQRITRYPLLLYAIIDCLEQETPAHDIATRALLLVNQVVVSCNEGARRMETVEQLMEIDRRLIYKSADLKRIGLVTKTRFVVKSGVVTQLSERNRNKASKLNVLQSKQRARDLFLFLFNDLLLIAKRKPNGTFICKDYAARQFVVTEPVEPHSHKVPPGVSAALPGKPHLFFCILMNNARGKHVELLLNADSESDRERWLSTIRPPTSANPAEKIYAEWDCPEAVAAHNYEAVQEDELGLETGDIVNILRKMPDGWYYGERARDGKGGWFPSSYVQLILNDHIRANNYRQRLRLFQAVTDYRIQHNSTIRDRRSGSSKRASLPASALLNASSSFNGIASNGVGSSNGFRYAFDDQHCVLDGNPRAPQEHLLISRLRRLSNPKALFSTSND